MRPYLIPFLIAVMFAAQTFAQNEKVTIFLAGDSTMSVKLPEKRPETGWGEMFSQHFIDCQIKIDNRAQNGRSTKTFISEGRWQAMIDSLEKGHYVFIQFGHNDASKDKGERYTPPEDFRKNLIKFVAEVRAKKAFPVLLTSVMRRRFDAEGKFYDTHGEYPDIVRNVSADQKVPLIDLHRSSEALIKKYGVENSRKLFLQLKAGENPNYPNGVEDNTHFSPLGAEEMAKLVVQEIKENKIALRKYLK
ncbi:MAG: rhamnogalacturonan acetylesterase [Saprospiraceae bacterium]|nr:rhamnogalacturonan acetylesterase [Pyrinomonadaceae bacterium]